jgi:hypothetical protein
MRGRVRRGSTVVLAVLALIPSACSSGAESVPPACLEGTGAILRALAAAPQPVRVDGVRISRCFARRSGAGDIESMGAPLVDAAARLAARARADPDGRPAVELGYLVGAAERGESRTEGIHYELLRRLQSEATGIDTPAYRAAEAAGRRSG